MRLLLALALTLFSALLVGGGVQTAASAPEDQADNAPAPGQVRMEVRAGFDGAGRVGGWVPLEVQLTNEGSELRADVQVLVQQGGRGTTLTLVPTTFDLPVVLPRLSSKRFSMQVPLPQNQNSKLTARLVRSSGGELITEQDISMAHVPLGDYFCGVLARDPAAFDFLSTLDLPAPIRRARTVPLEPATLPDQVQLLGSFDCLIVNNAPVAQLRQEQLDALQVWVGGGGLLIEVGGPTWQSTLGPLPPDLLPVEPTGLQQVGSLSALGDLVGVPMDQQGPWLLSQSRPRPDRGAHVVASQDGVPLVVAAKRGAGTVIYLAFEPTGRGVRGWTGNENLWRYLVTHASLDDAVGSSLVRPYLRWGRPPKIGLADFSAQPRPSLGWFWSLVGGYGLLLGGALFVLGRRGRVGWGLLASLGLTTVATAAGLLVALGRAEPDLAATRLIVVRPVGPGPDQAAYTHELVSMLARRDGAFTFALGPGSLGRGLYYPFPRPTDESDAAWPFRVSEGAQPSLEGLPLKQGQLATAQIEGQLRSAPGVQSDLQIENGALTGTITNRTGGRLSDAFVVVDADIRSLGTLEKDQARQVDVLLPPRAAAGSVAASQLAEKLTPSGASGRPGAAARRDWIESLFSARFLFQRMELRGPTLLGWLETPPSTLSVPDFRLSATDFTLLVQPLDPQLPRGFEGEVPAAAMNRRDLGIGSGSPSDREYYTVAPGESITLQFLIPPSDGTFRLRELRLNLEGSVTGKTRGQQPPFTVSLFNWKAGEWQAWDVGTGSSIVPDGARYVSAAGEVRLRYAVDAALQSSVREVRLTRLDVTPIGSIQ